jgi:cobaltochelatase CobS
MSTGFDINTASPEERAATIACAEPGCTFKQHSLISHLKSHGLTVEEYQAKHPGAEVLSPLGKKVWNEHVSETTAKPSAGAPVQVDSMKTFGIGFGKTGKEAKMLKGYAGYTADDGVPKIDEHYAFQEAVTRDVIMGCMAGGRIYASGPTGSGKTTLFEQIAARLGKPFYRFQFHGEMEPTEMYGNWTVGANGEMIYLYSGLALAMRQPSIICLDEFDSGNPPVTAIANALLEGNPLILPNKGGEKIIPHPDAIFVATGNTNGMGDETGLYASTSAQSFATMNRFQMFVTIGYMPAKDEIDLVKRIYGAKGMPDVQIQDMVKVANLVRDGFVGNKITAVMSTRQLLTWAKWLGMTGDPARSFQLAFSNQLGAVDKAVVLELYQRVYGSR